ncbi:SHOCT domain-containing protein [Halomonas aquatica]|uniref:SHOCT domain-containing protein n=1 Tax=Halomonas aquatica TaxID=3151123 RepID=A0ABV1NHE4_9GAMM
MKLLKIFLSIAVVGALSGCAHRINVAPELANIESLSHGFDNRSVSVGYYIPSELLSLEVTTPGGGGDNVRYFPYRDIETGYERVLSNVYSGVVKLRSTPDYSRTKQLGLDYVIQPQIVTSSGSTGFFTWPPTNFTVDLENSIRDESGTVIAAPRVVGVGTAETAERLSDHGVAGKRAMNDALSKMQAALLGLKLGAPSSNESTIKTKSPRSSSVASRLGDLNELKGKSLITEAEYEAKRKEILNSL